MRTKTLFPEPLHKIVACWRGVDSQFGGHIYIQADPLLKRVSA